MGLIRTAIKTVAGVAADQYKEYFYCEALPSNVIAVKGKKRVNGRSNNGNDNIISSGSVVAVADGQCMMIVDQGKVVELCSEAGEFVFDASTEPSIFATGLNKASISAVLDTIGKRFTFGGETAKDQRIYYFNTKELTGNKYGTPSPVPFRVVDTNIGLDIDIGIRCFGEYSYRVTNPMLFYKNVCGNVSQAYTRDQLESQMKSELLTALQPAFGRLSERGIRYSALTAHTMEMADALNEILSNKWRDIRGIEIVQFGVSSVKASDEDEAMIKELQRAAVLRNSDMRKATYVNAAANAMQDAAKNSAGAMTGFMGMGMAMNTSGISTNGMFEDDKPAPAPVAAPAAPANSWTCSCGAVNTGKFCCECGTAKPADGWTCACGAVNKGKFCSECGSKKPAGALLYKCDKCGWEPEDPAHPPKFCPECGDIFDEGDIVK